MLILVLIAWILVQLSAPVWCWVVFGFSALYRVAKFGWKISIASKEQKMIKP